MAVHLGDGEIQLMKAYDDLTPISIKTGMTGNVCLFLFFNFQGVFDGLLKQDKSNLFWLFVNINKYIHICEVLSNHQLCIL